MLKFLFLLLPLAAVYSWHMGRRSVKQQSKQRKPNRLSQEHIAEVNFLLFNQQDKAVDLLLDMLKLQKDSNTIEVHLTLGSLFRSRGEIDRAIRVHQALMKSAFLTFEQRLLVIQQLGRDYMTAGFYDRAEDMLNQLINEEDFRVSALSLLLQIYQSTSEWSKAIDVAEKLVKLGKKHRKIEIANFYCELAVQAINYNDMDRAVTLLEKGKTADKNSARISIMLAKIHITQKNYADAIQTLTQVLDQDREMVSETLSMLQECYQALGQLGAWIDFLKRCVEENTGSAAELLLTDIIEREQGSEVAHVYINKQLRQHPTMRMFHRLMSFHLSKAQDECAKESLKALHDMLGEQIRTNPHYRCQKCGFTLHNLYWRCPSCKSWVSVKPIRGLDGQ